jgi:putative Mn2+ efflux pump MntP
MNVLNITVIAIGLAMDAFAVSITRGFSLKNLKIKYAFRIALFFGLFQAFMPIIGWLAGLSLKDFIASVDHWIAFGLLCLIGCKMIYESFKTASSDNESNALDVYVLLALSIATSIDAMVVGVTFAFLVISIVTPIITIGIVTFLLSFVGVYIGNSVGHFFEGKIEIIGGFILISIGIKILIEHLA